MLRGLATAILGLSFLIGPACSDQPVILDLETSCRLTVQTNPRVLAARAAAEQAATGLEAARSALRPRLDISSNYNRVSKDTQFAGTPILEKDTVYNRAELRHIIYSGGRVGAAIRRAAEGDMASRQAYLQAEAEAVAASSRAYFRARQAREGIAVAESSSRALQASLDDARKLFEAGVVTRADVLRSEVALTAAREAIIAAQNTFSKAMAALKNAIGLSQQTTVVLAEQSGDVLLDNVAQLEPEPRPGVVAAEALLRASEAAAAASRAEKRPSLAFVADFQNEPAGSEFPRRSNSFAAGVMATMNIFDGGLTSARIEEAEAGVRKSAQELETARQAAALELEAARLDLESANARLRTTGTQVQSAEETLRVLKIGYREGINPLSDVLAAESALTAAKVSRLAAEYDMRIAQIDLAYALGRTDVLWKH